MKKFLLTPVTKLLLLVLFMLGTFCSQAATYTWSGAAAGGDWQVAANWGGSGYPGQSGTTDVVIINPTASMSITNVPNIEITSMTITVAAASAFPVTLTQATGELKINGFVKYTGYTGTSTAVGLNTGTQVAPKLHFLTGSYYQHNINSGFLPWSTWDQGSQCRITAITNGTGSALGTLSGTAYPGPLQMTQTFRTVIWNCPGQSAIISLYNSCPGYNTTGGDVIDSFVIFSMNGQFLDFSQASNNATIYWTGDLNLHSGKISVTRRSTIGTVLFSVRNLQIDSYCADNPGSFSGSLTVPQINMNSASAATNNTVTLLVRGNFKMDPTGNMAGTYQFAYNSVASAIPVSTTPLFSYYCNLIVRGNFAHNNGYFNPGSNVGSSVIFDGSTSSAFSSYNNLVSLTAAQPNPLMVSGGATLDIANNSSLSLLENFSVAGGAGLKIGLQNGLTSNAATISPTMLMSGRKGSAASAQFNDVAEGSTTTYPTNFWFGARLTGTGMQPNTYIKGVGQNSGASHYFAILSQQESPASGTNTLSSNSYYRSAGNYTYYKAYASGVQNTGAELPATLTGTLTINNPSNVQLTNSITLTQTSFTGTTSTNTITGVPQPNSLYVGALLSGTNIPANTYVTDFSGYSANINLSKNSTASGAGTFTISGAAKVAQVYPNLANQPNGSTTLTFSSISSTLSPLNISIGSTLVNSTYFAPGTTVTGITGNQVTISPATILAVPATPIVITSITPISGYTGIGGLTLTSGNLVTNSNSISFDPATTNPTEINTSMIEGTAIMNARTVNAAAFSNFLGLAMGAGNNIGTLTFTRKTGTAGVVNDHSANSIQCNWNVTTASALANSRTITLTWLSGLDNSLNFSAANLAKVYYSTDAGATWTATGTATDVSGANPRTITVTVPTGIVATNTRWTVFMVPGITAPVADFSANRTSICVGDCIDFTDLSTNTPTSWAWTFTGAATTSSASQNPTTICYNTAGNYTVALTATNAGGPGSTTKTNYITVTALPTVTPGANPAVCYSGSSQSENLSFSSTGSPDRYNIAWGVAASGAGFTDVTGYTHALSIPISLDVPGGAVFNNTYSGTLTVKNNTTGCISSGYSIGVDVNLCASMWQGNTSSDWGLAANWLPVAVPDNCVTNVTIPSGRPNAPVISATGGYSVGNMDIASGVTLTLQGQDLKVCGNWTSGNSGNAIIAGTGMVYLNGTFGVQSISGDTKFEILQLKNSSGISLAGDADISIATGLHLEHGQLDIGSGSLRLLSTASGNNSYIDDFTTGFNGSVNGSVAVDRYVPTTGYNQHFISSPVNAPLLSDLHASGPDGAYIIPSGNCDERHSDATTPYGSVFVYNDGHRPAGYCMMGNWMVKSAGNVANGKGYSTYLTGNSILSLTGTPNTGNISIGGLNNSGFATVYTLQNQPVHSGWNLVGNPYPSAINLTISRDTAGFQNQVQVWKTTGPFSGSWQTADIDTTPGGVIIPPFQAFMVRVKPGSLGVHNYPFYQTERVRRTDISFHRDAEENKLSLQVECDGLKDATTIAFKPNATNTFDDAYDANKPNGGVGRPTIYTTMHDDNWYGINNLSMLTQATDVTVGLRPELNKHMFISAQGVESFDATTYIFLEDKVTGTWHNLRDGVYEFDANTTDVQERFVIHFTPPAQILTTDATCDAAGMINIEQPGLAAWNYTITDNTNTTITSGTLNANNAASVPATPGVYQLSLTDNNGYSVVKSIIVGGSEALVAGFGVSTAAVQVQDNVIFTGATDEAVSYTWNFGDGSTASGKVVNHNYQNEGVYTATLTVTGVTGCTSVAGKTVTVTSRSITGINSITDNTRINIWSNEDRVYINFSKQPKVEAEIEIYNVLGQMISQEKFGRATLYSKEIENAETVYLVIKVKNGDQVTTKKVFLTAAKTR